MSTDAEVICMHSFILLCATRKWCPPLDLDISTSRSCLVIRWWFALFDVGWILWWPVFITLVNIFTYMCSHGTRNGWRMPTNNRVYWSTNHYKCLVMWCVPINQDIQNVFFFAMQYNRHLAHTRGRIYVHAMPQLSLGMLVCHFWTALRFGKTGPHWQCLQCAARFEPVEFVTAAFSLFIVHFAAW